MIVLAKFKDQADDRVEKYMKALIDEVSTFDRLSRFSISELMSVIKCTILIFYCRN